MSFADEFEKEIKKEKINNILNDKYIYLYLSFFYSLFNTNPLKLNKNNIYLNKILKERCVN